MKGDPANQTLNYRGPDIHPAKYWWLLFWLGLFSCLMAIFQIPWLVYLGWIVRYGADDYSAPKWRLFVFFFPGLLAVVTGIFPTFVTSRSRLGQALGSIGFLVGCAWSIWLFAAVVGG